MFYRETITSIPLARDCLQPVAYMTLRFSTQQVNTDYCMMGDIVPGKIGMGKALFCVSIENLSFVTGVCKGAPLSFQSGNSSSKALGSKQAPDSMCPPTNVPVSS